jgi:hypothetical protein
MCRIALSIAIMLFGGQAISSPQGLLNGAIPLLSDQQLGGSYQIKDPAIALNTDGTGVVAFFIYSPAEKHIGLRAWLLDNSGQLSGNLIVINDTTNHEKQGMPIKIFLADNEGFTLSWCYRDQKEDDSIYAISFIQMFDTQGTPLSSPIKLTSYLGYHVPQITVLYQTNNSIVTMWEEVKHKSGYTLPYEYSLLKYGFISVGSTDWDHKGDIKFSGYHIVDSLSFNPTFWPTKGFKFWLIWDIMDASLIPNGTRTVVTNYGQSNQTYKTLFDAYSGKNAIAGWLDKNFCFINCGSRSIDDPDEMTKYYTTVKKYTLPEWTLVDSVLIHSQIISYEYFKYTNQYAIACDTASNFIFTYVEGQSLMQVLGDVYSQYFYASYTNEMNYTDSFIPLCEKMLPEHETIPIWEPPACSSTPDGTFQIVFPYRDLKAFPGDPLWYIATLRGKIYDPTSITDNPKPEITVNINPNLANQNYSIKLSCQELASQPEASIFNLKGQLVNKLAFKKAEHAYQANWQTKDVTSGIYFLHWNWDGQDGERKLVVVR